MHPATGVELAHTRIDKGKASLPSLPAFEPLLVVVPFKVLGFTTKRFAAAQPGIGSENMVVELSPNKFANPSIDAGNAAMQVTGGEVVVENSEFSGNRHPEGQGGAVSASGGALWLRLLKPAPTGATRTRLRCLPSPSSS